MEAAKAPQSGGSGGAPSRRSGRSGSHSGRLLLRMPEGLHNALAQESEREGTSLNALITGLLADAVGWHGDGTSSRTAQRRGRRDTPAPAASRGVARLLAVNLVVVAAVGIVAVVLLVQALR